MPPEKPSLEDTQPLPTLPTIYCPIDHDALGLHMHQQGYLEGLRVGLRLGRRLSERILADAVSRCEEEFKPDKIPLEMRRSSVRPGDGVSLGDPLGGPDREF